MSEYKEAEGDVPISKRTRQSIGSSEIPVAKPELPTDDYDDISSTASTQVDSLGSRCHTPTLTTNRSFRPKHKNKKYKLQYKCTNFIKEDHGQPIFGIQINRHQTAGTPCLFATAGSNRVTIYECHDGGHMKLLQAYVEPTMEENFYCVAWTFNEVTGEPLLAAAGSKAIIRLINPVIMQPFKQFIGHGNPINELKFHPKDPNLLLSASKDHTLRLWNIKTDVCVAIFGGVHGHRDEVLSADFNIDGTRIVSCGMDHSLKIWRNDTNELLNGTNASYAYSPNSKDPFQTVCEHYPEFSTRDIHRNYVDCVRWLGDLVLSKSCENSIICWQPRPLVDAGGHKGSESNSVNVLHRFEYRECDIWYMRFSLDVAMKAMALGNQVGKIFMWDIDVEDPNQARFSVLAHPKCTAAIRQTYFSKYGDILLAVCDDSTVWRWDRVDSGDNK